MNKTNQTPAIYSRKSNYGHTYSGTTHKNSLSMIDSFLESEKATNNTEQWCKLNKSVKLEKLIQFANEYATKNNYSEEEESLLVHFFRDCLDKKKLGKVKDVVYNKLTGNITDVPLLVFNKNTKAFTLKKVVKNTTTLKVRSNSNLSDKPAVVKEDVDSDNISTI